MSQSRGVKIDVHHYSTCFCPHSACQHIGAMVTDMASGRKFIIEYGRSTNAAQADAKTQTTYEQELLSFKPDTATLYSAKDYDEFTKLYRRTFSNNKNYKFFSDNCADAVEFAINHFCPAGCGIDTFCYSYKMICCWAFLGSLGMKCFPSIFCTLPSDAFNLAKLLSFTSYGRPPTAAAFASLPAPASSAAPSKAPADNSLKTPMLSVADNVSVSSLSSSGSSALYATPPTLPAHLHVEDEDAFSAEKNISSFSWTLNATNN